MTKRQKTRIERDSLGEVHVPADAYWGASTQRAVLNFPIGELRYPRDFVHLLGAVKRAAALVNADLGLVDRDVAAAIAAAAAEVAEGKWDAHFVVDLFQTGSGTSTNTNANEVIARRARELLGAGDKNVRPNDDVNRSQSSNDVIPTVTHLAAARAIERQLLPALGALEQSLLEKSRQFWPLVKTGRTHLQDATPIRLGQEFLGFAQQVHLAQERLRPHVMALSDVALGGTAVGTGFNAHPEFATRVCAILAADLALPVRETPHHFQAQSTLDAVLAASGAVRSAAVSLQKIANDVRWLASGPRLGLGELALPAVQPGSSMMPGKVNPVIAESLLQVVCQVIGNDAAIAAAAQGGALELNTYWPVAGYNLHQAIVSLAAATANFDQRCIKDIAATPKGPSMAQQSLMLATALVPVLGYERAAALAHAAHTTGRTLRELARERTDLTEAQLDALLDPERMTEPGAGPRSSGRGTG